jgi:hypothetical protein
MFLRTFPAKYMMPNLQLADMNELSNPNHCHRMASKSSKSCRYSHVNFTDSTKKYMTCRVSFSPSFLGSYNAIWRSLVFLVPKVRQICQLHTQIRKWKSNPSSATTQLKFLTLLWRRFTSSPFYSWVVWGFLPFVSATNSSVILQRIGLLWDRTLSQFCLCKMWHTDSRCCTMRDSSPRLYGRLGMRVSPNSKSTRSDSRETWELSKSKILTHLAASTLAQTLATVGWKSTTKSLNVEVSCSGELALPLVWCLNFWRWSCQAFYGGLMSKRSPVQIVSNLLIHPENREI